MISTVAAGTDGSPTAAEAVRVAAEIAQRFGAKLVLVSAFQDSGGRVIGKTLLSSSSGRSARRRACEVLARAAEDLQREDLLHDPR